TRAREELSPFVPVVGVQAAIDQDRDAAERPFEAQVIGVLVSARVMPGTEQQVVVGCRGFFAEMRAEHSPTGLGIPPQGAADRARRVATGAPLGSDPPRVSQPWDVATRVPQLREVGL